MKLNNLYPGAAIQMQNSIANAPDAGKDLLPQVEVLKRASSNTVDGLVSILGDIGDPETLLEVSNQAEPRMRDLAPEGKYLEWLVNVKGLKHAFGGRYSVEFFLDTVEEDNPTIWQAAPNHVGTFTPLGQSSNTACGKCVVRCHSLPARSCRCSEKYANLECL